MNRYKCGRLSRVFHMHYVILKRGGGGGGGGGLRYQEICPHSWLAHETTSVQSKSSYGSKLMLNLDEFFNLRADYHDCETSNENNYFAIANFIKS